MYYLKDGEKPPVKVIYKLTDFGKTFVPALEAINNWGHLIVKEKGKYVG
ncbi:MAG: winged helix-turn-helix transcriptional regulator [Proteiniphilum sp.]|nr:winged helix-turn-helix transcriptional regulator [Proteiniphilum sp.]MEA5127367.1 winged helix-turn-helix transcriptional regulator [Proteiniphilum sp.]